ncbi:MAG TPA: hypothetical protein VGX68_06875 [Thermoanaerobaculia bacterium]|nr:hypothetical protein [Thermoanaerobaculia bacterium]
MSLRFTIASMILAVLPALALAAEPATPAPGETFHRVELKPTAGQGNPLPYTIEVPQEWQMRQVAEYPGLWIGPADAKPPEDPRLIWVRGSKVSMANPEEVVANIKANDAAQAGWSAPQVEVKEVGGVRGVLVRMDSGEAGKERSSLTLKLPLAGMAIDFIASADRKEFEQRRPLYERILFSVRPTQPANP